MTIEQLAELAKEHGMDQMSVAQVIKLLADKRTKDEIKKELK